MNETGLEEKREELAKSKVIEESAFHSRSYSYKRKKEASKQWSKDETLKFYKCLMNFGTDFSMIQQYYPNRTRAQIKRKYKTEERKNLDLVNGALTNTTHFDSDRIEHMFDEDKTEVKEVDKSANSEASDKITSRRRHKDVLRSDCSKISVCAYMMEEEIVLKNKRKRPSAAITAKNLKSELSSMPRVKNKKKNHTLSSAEVDTSNESLVINNDDINEKITKVIRSVRTLQDFHEEYQESITKYEESNSE